MKRGMEMLRSSWESLVEAVFPRRQRRIRAEAVSPERLPLFPETHRLLGHDVISLMQYEDARDLVQSLKYDRSAAVAHVLAQALGEYLKEDIETHARYSRKPVLLVPVPLHASRKAHRGYNQIGIVLDALPREFHDGTLSRIAAPILERTRATRPQTRLSRSERLSNVAAAFSVTDPEIVNGALVYLIDDVTTTGATLAHASRALSDAGAEVVRIALARA